MERGIPQEILAKVWLRDLVTDLSLQMPRINPKPKHVILIVDKEAMGAIFIQVLQFSIAHTIPPCSIFFIHLSLMLYSLKN